MSLLHPTPGELVDRATILELKIAAAKRAGKDARHFEVEKEEIDRILRTLDWVNQDSMPESEKARVPALVRGLGQLNELLWEAMDKVVLLPVEEVKLLAELAKSIAKWNIDRAELVRKINRAYGSDGPQEKMYGAQQEGISAT